MTQIQFYHLTATPMERAVPRLVEKAWQAGFRVHLVLGSEEQLDYLNHALWTFAQDSFLPHASAKDPFPEKAPVFLSCDLTPAPNEANILFVTEGSAPEAPEKFERVIDMFDGNSEEAVKTARARWKNYQQAGHTVSYFSQTPEGGWSAAS